MFPCPNYFFFKSFLFLQVFNSCRQSQSICMWKLFSLLHRLANGLFSSPSVLTGLCFWSWPCTWAAVNRGLGLGRSFPPPFSGHASVQSCNSKNWRFLLHFSKDYCWCAYLWVRDFFFLTLCSLPGLILLLAYPCLFSIPFFYKILQVTGGRGFVTFPGSPKTLDLRRQKCQPCPVGIFTLSQDTSLCCICIAPGLVFTSVILWFQPYSASQPIYFWFSYHVKPCEMNLFFWDTEILWALWVTYFSISGKKISFQTLGL